MGADRDWQEGMFPGIQGGNQGTGNFAAVLERLDKYESNPLIFQMREIHVHSNPAKHTWQGPPILLQREGNQGP